MRHAILTYQGVATIFQETGGQNEEESAMSSIEESPTGRQVLMHRRPNVRSASKGQTALGATLLE